MIKKIQWRDIPNTISGATKKKLREVAVLDPADLCFAVGEGSFAEDGREDLQVSATLAANMIVAYKTDNRTDEAPDAHFEAAVRTEKGRRTERRQGNPIVWGALSKAKVSILGTDEQPALVILGDGRQTAKTCVYVTELLQRCRALLNSAPTASGDDGWSPNNPGWVRGYVMQRDPVAAKFNDNVWHCVFTFSDKIGKPLVGQGYSARMHLTVDYTDDDPGNVRSLERASMANFRIPSTISGEAMKLRRLVEEYAFQDARNFPDHKYAPRYFLLLAKQYVQNPCAVGGSSEPSDAYVSALYDFSFVSPEIRAIVDAVKDPFAGIEAMRKAAKKYFVDSEAEIKRGDVSYLMTANALSEADQIAKRDKPRAERKLRAPKATVLDRASVYRADAEAVQASTAPMSREEQREVEVAAAWLSWLSGDKGALDAFPGLRKAAGLGEPTSEAWREAYDLVSAWDGKAMFSFREPITGDEADKQVVKDVVALISDMRDAMPKLPALAKPADRVAWAIDWMNANKGAK